MVYRGLSIISSGLEALDCMSIGWLERTSRHGRRRQSGPAFTATEFYHAVVGTLLSCELKLRLDLLVLGRAFIWPQTRVVWPGLYHSYDCWKHVKTPNAKHLHLRAWLPCIFCIQCCNWLEMLGVAVAAKFGKWSTSAQEDIHGHGLNSAKARVHFDEPNWKHRLPITQKKRWETYGNPLN